MLDERLQAHLRDLEDLTPQDQQHLADQEAHLVSSHHARHSRVAFVTETRSPGIGSELTANMKSE